MKYAAHLLCLVLLLVSAWAQDSINQDISDQISDISDEDIQDDMDLGLKRPSSEITDENIKDDMDLGLKHRPSSEITDDDIKDDMDLGLKHRPSSEITSFEITDKDIKDDMDLGLKHGPSSEIMSSEITDKDIKDDIDLGIKHTNPKRGLNLGPGIRMVEGNQKSEMDRDNSEKDVCDRYDVNGCSIPLDVPFFFKELFTPSCNRHDVCYDCGVKYNISRENCDEAFKDNMWKTCRAKYETENRNGKGNTKQIISRIADITESLLGQFNQIPERTMTPVLEGEMLSNDTQKELELFNNYALLEQRSVVSVWFEMLSKTILSKRGWKPVSAYTNQQRLNFNKEELTIDESETEEEDELNDQYETLCDAVMSTISMETIEATGLSCKEVDLLSCHFFDYLYSMAVRIFGKSHYKPEADFYCSEPFVHKCIPL